MSLHVCVWACINATVERMEDIAAASEQMSNEKWQTKVLNAIEKRSYIYGIVFFKRMLCILHLRITQLTTVHSNDVVWILLLRRTQLRHLLWAFFLKSSLLEAEQKGIHGSFRRRKVHGVVAIASRFQLSFEDFTWKISFVLIRNSKITIKKQKFLCFSIV